MQGKGRGHFLGGGGVLNIYFEGWGATLDFPPPKKRVFRVKKSPFLYWELQGKWGFGTQSTLFWGAGTWVFWLRDPLCPSLGISALVGGKRTPKTDNQCRVVADVWEKDVWDFQAKSGSSGSCRLFLRFVGKSHSKKCLGNPWKSHTSFFQTSAAFWQWEEKQHKHKQMNLFRGFQMFLRNIDCSRGSTEGGAISLHSLRWAKTRVLKTDTRVSKRTF